MGALRLEGGLVREPAMAAFIEWFIIAILRKSY